MRNPAALSLYRRLLRLHRKVLPDELRQVGDKYLAQEFRAHKDVDDFAQISTFMREWADYAAQLSMQVRVSLCPAALPPPPLPRSRC